MILRRLGVVLGSLFCRRVRTLFVIASFFLVSASVLAQVSKNVDEGIEKRIEGIAELVKSQKFEQATAVVGDLVGAYPYRYDSHMAAFQTNLQAYKNSPDDPKSGRYLDKALKHLNVARRIDPEDLDAWQASIAFWDPARIDARPKDQEAEKMLAEAEDRFAARELDQAAESLKKVITKEPGYAPAYRHLAQISLGKKQLDEALKYARTGIERDPRDPGGLLLLASVYGNMGSGEDAMRTLIRSLSADPSYPLAWRQLTRLDLGGRYVEHMTGKLPKPVLWIIEREIEAPTDKDWEGVLPLTRPAWKAYIARKVKWRQTEFAKRNPTFKIYRYTFEEESGAIVDMLTVWKEAKTNNPNAEDALLDHWLAASEAAALDAAIYTDMFLEEWRQDFTAWKQENRGKFEEYFTQFVLPRALAGGKQER